ncbi:MAG: hypothetical protein F6K17_41755 [Okeania sp. SIO3C4]|nr:hypothetical protein [Okeania sp. SIO3C4]
MTTVVETLGNTDINRSKPVDISHSRTLLEQITCKRQHRSKVSKISERTESDSQIEVAFFSERDGSQIDSLLLKEYPDLLRAPSKIKKKILSFDWIAYREKAINIESKIISPTLIYAISEEIPKI